MRRTQAFPLGGRGTARARWMRGDHLRTETDVVGALHEAPAQDAPKCMPLPGESAPHFPLLRRGRRPRRPAQTAPFFAFSPANTTGSDKTRIRRASANQQFRPARAAEGVRPCGGAAASSGGALTKPGLRHLIFALRQKRRIRSCADSPYSFISFSPESHPESDAPRPPCS